MKPTASNLHAMKLEEAANALGHDLETGLPIEPVSIIDKPVLERKPACHDDFPAIAEKATKNQVDGFLKQAIENNHPKQLYAVFSFMLEHEYTPEQIIRALGHIHKGGPDMEPGLLEWGLSHENAKIKGIKGKALFVAIFIQARNEHYKAAIDTLELSKKHRKGVPHDFTEAMGDLEIEAWLGFMEDEKKQGTSPKIILDHLEQLCEQGIWSRDLARFGVPVGAAWFREQALEAMQQGQYSDAFKSLEKAIKLPEDNPEDTYSLYSNCISQVIHHPRFQTQMTEQLTEALFQKIDQLHKKEFWNEELKLAQKTLLSLTPKGI